MTVLHDGDPHTLPHHSGGELITALLAAALTLSIVSGDGQRGVFSDGGIGFAPLVVRVTDRAGRPVSGARVRFVCVAPDEGCFLGSLRGGTSATVATGRDGRAVLGSGKYGVFVYWTRATAYTRKNPAHVEIVASVAGAAPAVRFDLTPLNPFGLPSSPFYMPE